MEYLKDCLIVNEINGLRISKINSLDSTISKCLCRLQNENYRNCETFKNININEEISLITADSAKLDSILLKMGLRENGFRMLNTYESLKEKNSQSESELRKKMIIHQQLIKLILSL